MASEWLKTVISCSNFFENLNESETMITMMSGLIFCEVFSPVHVIITTIIIKLNRSFSIKQTSALRPVTAFYYKAYLILFTAPSRTHFRYKPDMSANRI